VKRPNFKPWWPTLKGREKRLLLYLLILGSVVVWKFTPRHWKPAITIETPHYTIASTATQSQTEEMGRMVEILYTAYSNRFNSLPQFETNHPKLKLILYKDQKEFRRINPSSGWAEAFYRKPNCRAYYPAEEINPYHWMLHEAVHQLNEEVAHLDLAKWLEEGLAEYFSTSRIRGGRLMLGRIDPNTYPVWWIEKIATEADLKKNLENGSVIPLHKIVSDERGPRLTKQVNLYYLHWWSLTHFIFEDERYRPSATKLVLEGGKLTDFEHLIGPAETIQPQWHQHVRRIKAAIDGNNLKFFATGELPAMTNSNVK